MKVCIISMMNIKHSTMTSFYERLFKERNINFDMIYFDRYGITENCKACKKFVYSVPNYRELSYLNKLIQYWKFRSFIIKVVKNNSYQFLVIWRTETAHLIGNFLLRYYHGKYGIDIRDYFHESNFLIYNRLARIIKNSRFTTISSEGYLKFLPPNDYLMLHSINEEIIRKVDCSHNELRANKPIRICFIGYVRFPEIDKILIEKFANDKRFILQYFGEGSYILEDYCLTHNIKNVQFIKRFNVEETTILLGQADVINNVYGAGNIALDTAISIRFYYSVFLELPIMTSDGTYISEVAKNVGNGFTVDITKANLADDFYYWYQNIDWKRLKNKLHEYQESLIKHNCSIKRIIEKHIVVAMEDN